MIKSEENPKNIEWDIDMRFERVEYHVQEVSLIGYDEEGNKYSAHAVEVCGEIEDITEIQKL